MTLGVTCSDRIANADTLRPRDRHVFVVLDVETM